MLGLPQRRHPRLKDFDYSHGWYFVTICTDKRKRILSRPTTLSDIVRSIKAMVTRELGYSIWQTSFYDHVIRTEADYLRIWQYIDENPACWAEDEYYSE